MDRIVLTPEHVRGLGNIIGDKSIGDFAGRYCTVSSATDTISGQSESVWKTTRTNTAYTLSVDYPVKVAPNTDFDVSVSVSSGTVFFYCIWNNEVYSTDSKVSSHTFSLPAVMSGRNTVTVYCSSTDGGSVLASRSVPIIVDDASSTVRLLDTLNLTEPEGSTDLFAEYKVDDIGVAWNTLYFYEVYNRLLRWLRSSPDMVEDGSTIDVGVLLTDNDGSLVTGEVVYFYEAYEGVRAIIKVGSNIVTGNQSTLTLTGSVLDTDGSRVPDETINFYRNGDLLGSSVSGDDGVATYTYTNTGYNGEGVKFTTGFDSVRSNVKLVGEFIQYDTGVSGSAEDIYYTGENITRTVTDEGTLFENTGSSTDYVTIVLSAMGSMGTSNQSYVVDLDIVYSGHHYNGFRVQDPITSVVTDYMYDIWGSMSVREYRIVCRNNTVTWYSDRTRPSSFEYETTIPSGTRPMVFAMELGVNASVTIKNVRVYREERLTLGSPDSAVQNGSSINVNATYSGAVRSGKSVSVDVLHNDTLIDTLTGTTNSSGVATVSYTGTGIGEVSFKAEYGTLQSEIYSLVDAIYYDDMSSDTTSNYFYNSNSGNNLVFDNNCFKFTVGTGNKYFHYGTNYGITGDELEKYKGKTIVFKAYVEPSYQCRLRMHYLENGASSYVDKNSDYVSESGEIELENTIPSNITRLIFRVDCTNNNSGETVKVRNFKVYPV